MKIARIIFPIKVLGPGDRVGLWLAGCPHRCKGCSNPELWDAHFAYNLEPTNIFDTVKKITGGLDFGITITGGEPFEQSKELCLLIKMFLELTDDILVYTGYTLEELKEKNDCDILGILNNASVIIDGKYIEEKNHTQPLIGSANQKIHYIKPQFKRVYQEYILSMKGKSLIQNFASNNSIISVGIHSPDFNSEFDKKMKNHLKWRE